MQVSLVPTPVRRLVAWLVSHTFFNFHSIIVSQPGKCRNVIVVAMELVTIVEVVAAITKEVATITEVTDMVLVGEKVF